MLLANLCREPGTTADVYNSKLSNGTLPKGLQQNKEAPLEKQQSCPEDVPADLLVSQ